MGDTVTINGCQSDEFWLQDGVSVAKGATVTSDVQHNTAFNRITGWVFADKNGTLNITERLKATGTDRTVVSQATTANTLYKFDLALYGHFLKVAWTNGDAVNPATLELVSILRAQPTA